jgi:SAM-dependent methyltransferase
MSSGISATIEVSSVEQQGRSAGLLGFLDQPKAGDLLEGPRVPFVGWVIGSDRHRATGVEVSANGSVCQRLSLESPRPDVAAAYKDYEDDTDVGFRGDAAITGTAHVTLQIAAVLDDGSRVPLASMRVRRRLADADPAGLATLVSVVLTATDPDSHPDQAIESVLAQTYPNFELIVVDATGSGGGVAEAARRIPGLTVLESASSVSAARNAGLQASGGSVVVFLATSERLLPDAVELGLQELAAQPECAFVSGKCVVTRRYHDQPEYPQQPLVTADHYAVLLGRNYVLTPAAAIFRRAALEAVGGFDETLDAFADYDLYLRLAGEFRIGTHPQAVVESPADDPLRTAPETRAALDRVLDAQETRVAGDRHLETALRFGRNAWQRRLGEAGEDAPPLVGGLAFGDLRRLSPISTNFGFERGRPVDRYYIESFLAEHCADVRGRVLEVQENDYTLRFGEDRVQASDVLSLLPDNPRATMIGDLATGETIPSDTFDCAIVTQVLHLIHEPREAVQTLGRILKPGGIALVTVPGITQLEWSESWHWSFTLLSARQMFSDVFGGANVRARSYGNVLAATSFLWGVAIEELEQDELDYLDPSYPVTIAVRAVKLDSG